METIRTALKAVKEYKVVAFAALALVVLIVGTSVARCTAVHAPADAEQAQQEQRAEESQQEQGPQVSEQQQELIDGYSGKVAEFVSLLSANAWTAQQERKSLTFADNAFTETDSSTSSSVTHTFAVSSYRSSSSTETGANGETRNIVVHDAAILTDAGTFLLTMRQSESPTGEGTWSLVSNAFQYSDSYVLSHSAETLSVSGINEAFTELLGGSSGGLKSAVVEHCSKYFPTAKNAEWSGQATVDWEAGTITTSFKLDNSSRSSVSAVIDMETGEVTVE